MRINQHRKGWSTSVAQQIGGRLLKKEIKKTKLARPKLFCSKFRSFFFFPGYRSFNPNVDIWKRPNNEHPTGVYFSPPTTKGGWGHQPRCRHQSCRCLASGWDESHPKISRDKAISTQISLWTHVPQGGQASCRDLLRRPRCFSSRPGIWTCEPASEKEGLSPPSRQHMHCTTTTNSPSICRGKGITKAEN